MLNLTDKSRDYKQLEKSKIKNAFTFPFISFHQIFRFPSTLTDTPFTLEILMTVLGHRFSHP